MKPVQVINFPANPVLTNGTQPFVSIGDFTVIRRKTVRMERMKIDVVSKPEDISLKSCVCLMFLTAQTCKTTIKDSDVPLLAVLILTGSLFI